MPFGEAQLAKTWTGASGTDPEGPGGRRQRADALRLFRRFGEMIDAWGAAVPADKRCIAAEPEIALLVLDRR